MSEIESTKNIERLLDVEMSVTVRFGATKIPLREVVHFGNGSMIELDRMVDEPVELLVNNFPFARGEVVVIDGYYSVKITEIESPEKRSSTFFPKTSNEPTQNFQPPEAAQPETDALSQNVREKQTENEQPLPRPTAETDEVQKNSSPNPVQPDEPLNNEE